MRIYYERKVCVCVCDRNIEFEYVFMSLLCLAPRLWRLEISWICENERTGGAAKKSMKMETDTWAFRKQKTEFRGWNFRKLASANWYLLLGTILTAIMRCDIVQYTLHFYHLHSQQVPMWEWIRKSVQYSSVHNAHNHKVSNQSSNKNKSIENNERNTRKQINT